MYVDFNWLIFKNINFVILLYTIYFRLAKSNVFFLLYVYNAPTTVKRKLKKKDTLLTLIWFELSDAIQVLYILLESVLEKQKRYKIN